MRVLAPLAMFFALCTSQLGCTDTEYCGAPGVSEFCTCSDGQQGARVCQESNTLGACDCSGAIALADPNPIVPTPATTGGSSSGGGSVSSGGGTTSSGGGTVSSGGGSMTSGGSETGGMETGGAETGGMETGGAETGGMETGGSPDPALAYQECPNGDECGEASACLSTALLQRVATVCQPECIDVGDCPVPEGSYDAELECVGGVCRFNCTPVLFQPLLSCPEGMECVAPLGGATICYDDGV